MTPLNEALVASRQALCGKGKLAMLSPVGSRAYGTNREESDYDFKGVYVAPLRKILSLAPTTDNIARSELFDLTLYELGSFCKLAAAANPTVLELLWADGHWVDNYVGPTLCSSEIRSMFLSKRIAKTYGGYAMGQIEKARRNEGSARGRDHFKREKFKLHTLRLLMAGEYALDTGEILVKLGPSQVDTLRIGAGLPFESFSKLAGRWLRRLNAAADISHLPDEPNIDGINYLLYTLRMGTL